MRSRAASPRAAPRNVRFTWEPIEKNITQIERLLGNHWREVDVHHEDAPLDPDWKRYVQLEQFGWLGFVTARDNGVLVGYMTIIIGPHIHHRTTKWATIDVMYLSPEYREGWTGVRFVKTAERGLRKLGVKVIWFAVKAHFKNKRGRTVEEVLKFLKFNFVEAVYAKVLK